jgi:pyruvate,water dikinase
VDPWQPVGSGRYVGTPASTRYPIYTRGNAGEVFPEVWYPLSFTTSWEPSVAAWHRAALGTGLIRPADLEGEVAAAAGVFGGYAYLNMSLLRLMGVRSPGVAVGDIDAQYLGNSTAPPYRARRGDHNMAASAAAVVYALRTLRAKALPELDADRARVEAWRRNLPDLSAPDADLVAALDASTTFLAELFEHHLVVSGKVTVALGGLTSLLSKKLGNAADLPALLAGIGGVDSAEPAESLWELGRQVAADPELGALFDLGINGLEQRLGAAPAATGFRTSFGRFLERFGSRGPNEWETGCDTWGTNPELALALVDRMRGAAADHDPRARQAGLAADRAATTAAVGARLGRLSRRRLVRLLDNAALYLQGRERAKTTVVLAIHEGRIRLRELAARASARARAAGVRNADPMDLWFVTRGELDAYLADPAPFAAAIAERRAMRRYLAEREPPFVFDGAVPPPDTWPLRSAASRSEAVVGTTLTGIPGCPGVARGRARVVLHPGDPGDLGAGDVLVAPITDPAWTPLFVPAEAVVVDVGALLSHAVIVARELGIPAVVSVTDATRTIPDGALIEVDGTAGTVTVLEQPSP